MTRLVVAYPGSLPRTPAGSFVIDEKLRSGLARYQEAWPAAVVLAVADSEGVADAAAGTSTVAVDALPVEVVTGPTWSEAVRRARPDVLLAPLIDRLDELTEFLDRSVLVAEFTPGDLRDFELARAGSGTARTRVRLGSGRRARRFGAWARRARGVQCNGYPSFGHFAPVSSRPMLFFDTRLTADHVGAARLRTRSGPERPPRMCFSGRLIDAKGADVAVRVARLVQEQGSDAELVVLGHGPLEERLRREASSNVRFLGSMDFEIGWTRFVREEVDLMLLPHRQGDPSGTYLEAAGCGVPVLGFDNVALASLVERHGLGWTVPLGDTDVLAEAAVRVLADTAGWATAREHGLAFMGEHHMDAEFTRRVDHLHTCT